MKLLLSNPVSGMLPNLGIGFTNRVFCMRWVAAAASATAKHLHFLLGNIASWTMTGDAHRFDLIDADD
ncbi:MAG TPA: hypothetical protein PLD30_16675 [Candidatus Competibacteraceae bacterium]|nr:hypothetical protein [Candidatus Competibacteraceae bacterium]